MYRQYYSDPLFIRSKIQFFESKSQLKGHTVFISECCLSDQRYNFLKANHNDTSSVSRNFTVVYQIKDTIFWKQITTKTMIEIVNRQLFIRSKIQFFESKSQHLITSVMRAARLFIRSKIQFFESKSQHIRTSRYDWFSCLSDQRYNFLKANHNWFPKWIWLFRVVYQIKDTIFWKQITTVTALWNLPARCLSDQRYNFLKANHNKFMEMLSSGKVVYQIKDTIFWKQITTEPALMLSAPVLFIRSKIQFFESKSQPEAVKAIARKGCLSDQRYNFLKANHN